MSDKNLRVKTRILGIAEEIRDKSNSQNRPGRIGSQRKIVIDVPVVEIPRSEWDQRLEDAQRVLRYGPDVDNDNPPVAVTYPATGVVHNLADLWGELWLPQEIATVVTFDYGTTEAMASSAAAAESPVSVAGPTSISATIAGLTPSTKYYFRIRAVNATKTVIGLTKSFTTDAAP